MSSMIVINIFYYDDDRTLFIGTFPFTEEYEHRKHMTLDVIKTMPHLFEDLEDSEPMEFVVTKAEIGKRFRDFEIDDTEKMNVEFTVGEVRKAREIKPIVKKTTKKKTVKKAVKKTKKAGENDPKKIYNPESDRYVLKTGAIGLAILAN